MTDMKFRLCENFESIDILKSRLNSNMLKVLKDSSGGSDDIAVNADWDGANEYSDDVKSSQALVDLYLYTMCNKKWGISIDRFDEGKSIIEKIFDELGFNSNDNPYIDFISVFYKNNDISISEDGWVNLNDWYANGEITAADLRGTGGDGSNHLIFNKNIYLLAEFIDNGSEYMSIFSSLGRKYDVLDMNVYAMSTYEGSPYGALKQYTEGGEDGTGKFKGNDYRIVRNTIFYENPKEPLGRLHSFNDVKTAYTKGTEGVTKGESDRSASGEVIYTLKVNIKDGVANTMKSIVASAQRVIDSYKDKYPDKVKSIRLYTGRVNKALSEDKNTINDYLRKIKSDTDINDIYSDYDELNDYVNNNLKLYSFSIDRVSLKDHINRESNIFNDDNDMKRMLIRILDELKKSKKK